MRPLWNTYRYFDENENWGDPSAMEHSLVSALDEFRDFVGRPIHVLQGTQGEHKKTSWHYKGRAVDICFLEPGDGDTLFGFFLNAIRFRFTGIGLYPHWKYNGVVVGGLHLEIADAPPLRRQLWMGVRESEGAPQSYTALSPTLLRRYGVI